ncbi:MAG: ABC transporter ATP-binding protein [Planctomycetes bacterium]|nr:ABC transporter ATP-binding protein [Planctomycetota bacterium]
MFKNLKLFYPFIRKYKHLFIGGFLALLIVDLFDVMPQLIIKYALDELQLKGFYPYGYIVENLLMCAVFYIMIAITQDFFRYFMRRYFHGSGFIISRDLKVQFYEHIQKLPPSFYNKTKTGDLMSRATADIDSASQFYSGAVFIGLDNFFYFLTVPFIMFSLSPELMLYALIPVPILPFFVNRISNLIHKKFKESQEILSKISAFSQENFSGVKVIKSFSQEQNQIMGFAEINKQYVTKNLELARLNAFFGPSLQLVISTSVLIVIIVGGKMAIDEKITIGTYAAFQAYLLKIIGPMIGLGWTMSIYQRAAASMERLQEIFNVQPAIKDADDAITDAVLDGDIEFNNVTVMHEDKCIPSLDNFNLRIKKGTTVAIVGPIGGGKSTILNLLPRFLEPTSGEITINGISLNKIALKTLRGNIGYVQQESFLFSDTISGNIAFGASNADDKTIQKAAEIAMVHKDIRDFPDGYETMLGERGVNLSGGQRQRITLARAVIKDPHIILLDDCLSSVDSDTEEEILKNLNTYLAHRTCLIVTHRVPAVKIADEIIFMDDGKIIEHGTHEELLKHNVRYADFYNRQQMERDLEKL